MTLKMMTSVSAADIEVGRSPTHPAYKMAKILLYAVKRFGRSATRDFLGEVRVWRPICAISHLLT